MESTIGKQQILEALRDLPENASVEDAIERLVFLAKVREGLAQLDAGQGLEHDAVKKRLGL
jgi:predicted transcriptional regulator